jgi:hypothetical protein
MRSVYEVPARSGRNAEAGKAARAPCLFAAALGGAKNFTFKPKVICFY